MIHTNLHAHRNVLPPSPMKRKRTLPDYINFSTQDNCPPAKRFKAFSIESKNSDVRTDIKTYSEEEILQILNKHSLELKNQVHLTIHSIFYLNCSKEKQNEFRQFVAKICSNAQSTEEEKMAELGVLFYYFVSEKKLPPNAKFMAARINEIEVEIKDLKKAHADTCPKNLQKKFPSGCNAYLYRALVRMIFPGDGSFNPGGCLAVKNMMQSRLALYLSDEGRLQILKVVMHLLKNEQFQNCFMHSFEVKKELQELILIDMKLSKENQFNFIYVRWALLLLFFHPIGQFQEPNCFAIAPVANLINDSSLFNMVCTLLIDILKTGNLNFEGTKISLLPFINIPPIRNNDFHISLGYEKISQMTSFAIVDECLKDSDFNELNEIDELNELTESLGVGNNPYQSLDGIMEFEYNGQAAYAKQLFLSLKQVSLQQLLLSIIEFVAINSTGLLNSKKSIFIKKIKNEILKKQEGADNDFNFFACKFLQVMNKTVYLVDDINLNVEEEGVTEVISRKENPSFYNYFSEKRIFCILGHNMLLPIYDFPRFRKYFLKVAYNVAAKFGLENHNSVINFIKFIDSSDFTNTIHDIIVQMNGKNKAEKTLEYLKLNHFFLKRTGGVSDFLQYNQPFNSHFNHYINIVSKTVESFFNSICLNLVNHSQANPQFLQKISPWVIIESEKHIYNLCPFLFKEYWQADCESAIKNNIINRAYKNRFLSSLRIKKILECTLSRIVEIKVEEGKEVKKVEIDAQKIYDKFCKKRSCSIFTDEVKMEIPAQFHNLLNKITENVMNELEISTVTIKLPELFLKFTNAKIHSPEYDELMKKLIKKKTNDQHFISTIRLATWMHKVLLTANPAVYKSIFEIENTIRSYFDYPEIIKIANLNWIDEFSEKPIYKYLCIRYSFIDKCLQFSVRAGKYERPLDKGFIQDIFSETNLIFSKN